MFQMGLPLIGFPSAVIPDPRLIAKLIEPSDDLRLVDAALSQRVDRQNTIVSALASREPICQACYSRRDDSNPW